jgi:hypothetical protein
LKPGGTFGASGSTSPRSWSFDSTCIEIPP